MRKAALVLAALVATGPALAGELPPARQDALENLVRQDCGSCHGMTLKGGLGPDIRAETLAGRDPDALKTIILDGVPGSAMPPWRPLLSESDVDWIVQYLLKGKRP